MIEPIRFATLGQRVGIACEAPALRRVLAASFAGMAKVPGGDADDVRYRCRSAADGFVIEPDHGKPLDASTAGDALFLLEKDLTLELQRRRPELLFLHAAALGFEGAAILLAGDSGKGKSTTAWALLGLGFDYLSDELSPVDLLHRRVLPYPFALSLKHVLPACPVPPEAIDLDGRTYVPVTALGARVAQDPLDLAAVLLMGDRGDGRGPAVSPLGAADAAARLYGMGLNLLAHPGRGLDAVLGLVRRVPCYIVEAGEIAITARAIRSTVEALVSPRRDGGAASNDGP